MNLIRYNHMILGIFCLLSVILAKEVKPIDSQAVETLKIYSKDREYYNLFDENLIYNVEGPCVLHVHSRLAFPQLTKKPKPYQFSIKLASEEFTDTLIIDNHFRLDPNVFRNFRILANRAFTHNNPFFKLAMTNRAMGSKIIIYLKLKLLILLLE